MEPISFFDRIKYLFNIILESPFFIVLFVIAILTLALLIINVKTNKKIVKIITGCLYGIIVVLLFIKYGSSIIAVGDTIIDKIFTAIYFPNYISYICMIIISILLFLSVFFNKKLISFGKYTSILIFIFLVFLFVLTLETIVSNNIDITSKQSIYSNESLVILIQTSTIIFAIWIVLYIISLIVTKVDDKSYMSFKKEKPNKNIFEKLRVENLEKYYNMEDPTKIDDEAFAEALKNYQKKTEKKNLPNIIKK